VLVPNASIIKSYFLTVVYIKALAVSGEAVQAEFEAWLRSHLTCANYPDGLQQLIYQICRKFKEEKKDCGLPPRPGSKTWNLPAPGLRPNRDKGFEKDHMKIDRYEDIFS